MGYRLGYSGPEVDVLLQKAYKYSVVNNGWAKLDSSDSNPVDLDSLVTQGNYSISFWNNGPVQLNTSGPINVCVTKDSSNGKTYQTIYDAGKVYLRETTGTSFSNTWIEEQNNTDLDINASVPQNPQDNYVWIDISGEEPTIKVYKESTHSWIATSAADLAKASVYDPQGIKQPIDTYLNQKITDADLSKAEQDYNAHLIEGKSSGNPIHVTTEEKAKWNAGISKTDAFTIVDGLKTEMTSYANQKINTSTQEVGNISDKVDSAASNIDKHIADSTIHITAEDATSFDNKAAGDHKHLNDGHVTVSAANITGMIAVERLDPSVLERNYTVTSYEEMMALTINDVQNGDSVFINGTNQSAWFVVDDTKLGTADAFVQYAAPAKELTWENITNKPSTLAEFNITTSYTKDEINTLYNNILASINEVKNKADEYNEAIGTEIPANLDETIATNTTSANDLNSKVDILIRNTSLNDTFKNQLLSLVQNKFVGDIDVALNKTVTVSYEWTVNGGPGLSAGIITPAATKYDIDLENPTTYKHTVDTTYTSGMIDDHEFDGYYTFNGWDHSGVINITKDSSKTINITGSWIWTGYPISDQPMVFINFDNDNVSYAKSGYDVDINLTVE